MKVRYVGPLGQMEVPGVGVTDDDGVLDAPTSVARSLCEQSDWQPVTAKGKGS